MSLADLGGSAFVWRGARLGGKENLHRHQNSDVSSNNNTNANSCKINCIRLILRDMAAPGDVAGDGDVAGGWC